MRTKGQMGNGKKLLYEEVATKTGCMIDDDYRLFFARCIIFITRFPSF